MSIIWTSRPEQIARIVVSGLLIVVMPAMSCVGCASKPLYRVSQVAVVATNTADWHSTQRALAHGARERNLLLPESAFGLAVVKAASAVAVLLAGDALESRGQRAVATAVLSAISVAIGLVAVHNYRVARD